MHKQSHQVHHIGAAVHGSTTVKHNKMELFGLVTVFTCRLETGVSMDTAVVPPDWFNNKNNEPEPKTKDRTCWTMSLALHTVLIALVAHFHLSPVPPSNSPAKAMKATLVYPALSNPDTEPSPVKETQKGLGGLVSSPVSSSTSELVIDKNSSENTTLTAPEIHRGHAESQPKARLSLSPATALKPLQSSQQQALLNQTSQQRRRLFTSPEIIDPRKAKGDKTAIIHMRKINCDKGMNGVIGLISGLAGGTLACSDRANDLNKFIDNHKK